MNDIQKTYFESPIGMIEISGDEKGISSVEFFEDRKNDSKNTDHLKNCLKQLDEYFSGKRKSFSLKLNLKGTEFQKMVWKGLLKIPFGETVSYLDVAKGIGNEKAVRAVGNANNKNNISIIIPCHRVIGSNGKLIGYGGGLWRKKWLIDFENGCKQK